MISINFDGKFRKHYAEVGDAAPCAASGLTLEQVRKLPNVTTIRFRELGAVALSDDSGHVGYMMVHECSRCFALVAASGIDRHEADHLLPGRGQQ
jgi:hypothetical protein